MPKSRRPRTRNAHGAGALLREELIAAAVRVLSRTEDADGFSLRAVAREAGVAAPSVYLHFTSKDGLVRAMVAEHFAALRERIHTAVTEASGPVERLRAGARAYCAFALEQPWTYRILFGKTYLAVADSAGEKGLGMDAFDVLVDCVSACMASGQAPVADATRAATNVWTALHGIVSLRGSAPNFDWPPLEEHVEDMLVGLVGIARGPDTRR